MNDQYLKKKISLASTAENISFLHILPKTSLILVYKESVKQPAGRAATHSKDRASGRA